ncbi:oxygenase MpaB family protein [Hamadaea sp. NPDC050747]|uniref:oxygenase MpaB family protein n=1 Tax=Hamadaea sp. NPDC050747 TaxID=3155789 RepID=UPI003404E2D6
MSPQQAQAIYRRLVLSDLSAEMKIGLFLAFCRTFGVASIGGLLASTGQTSADARSRAVRTRDTMYTLYRHGFDDPEGERAVRRLRKVHDRFPIANDDYLYVLGCLVVVPTRFALQFGRRPLTSGEQTATHAFYHRLAGLMGIDDVPGTYGDLEAWFDDYDRRNVAEHPAAGPLLSASRGLLVHRLPPLLRQLAARCVDVLLDDRLRTAGGISQPTRVHRALVWSIVTLCRLVPRSAGNTHEDHEGEDCAAMGAADR